MELSNSCDGDISKKQEANAFLRERFLYTISSMCGKNCKIHLYEGTEVTGIIKAFDYNFENIIVENLEGSSLRKMKMAVLRSSDIIAITYN